MQNNQAKLKETFKNPKFTQAQISLDGQWLSFIESRNLHAKLIVQSFDYVQKKNIAYESEQGIQSYWWHATGKYILVLNNNNQLYCIHTQSLNCELVLENKQIRQIQSPKKQDYFILHIKEYAEPFYSAYIFDPKNQNLSSVYDNKQYMELIVNEQAKPRFAYQFKGSGAEIINLAQQPEEKFIFGINAHDCLSLQRFSHLGPFMANDKLFFISSTKQNYSNLYEYDVEAKLLTCLSTDEKGDIFQVVLDPKTDQPIAYCRIDYRRQWVGLDDQTQKILEDIRALLGEDLDFAVTSLTQDNQQWMLEIHTPEAPCYYTLYDIEQKHFKPICQAQGAVFKEHDGLMQKVEIPSSDGITQLGYLSKTTETAPMIICLHGGPHSRDFWSWQPVHTCLVQNQFHVLSLNFRGSFGFGAKHLISGLGEWAGKILEDILIAREWCANQPFVDSEKIFLMGNSFGGYATMMLLLNHPDKFKAGIHTFGPADLSLLLDDLPIDWACHQDLVEAMLGVNLKDSNVRQELQIKSPINRLENLKIPLLMAHGQLDPIVRVHQATKIQEKTEKFNLPIKSIIFENEGHQILNEQTRVSWFENVIEFLSSSG